MADFEMARRSVDEGRAEGSESLPCIPLPYFPALQRQRFMQVVGVAALRLELSSLSHKVEARYLHLVPERTTPATGTSPSDLTDGARMP